LAKGLILGFCINIFFAALHFSKSIWQNFAILHRGRYHTLYIISYSWTEKINFSFLAKKIFSCLLYEFRIFEFKAHTDENLVKSHLLTRRKGSSISLFSTLYPL
jgi:hypothetical protein